MASVLPQISKIQSKPVGDSHAVVSNDVAGARDPNEKPAAQDPEGGASVKKSAVKTSENNGAAQTGTTSKKSGIASKLNGLLAQKFTMPENADPQIGGS